MILLSNGLKHVIRKHNASIAIYEKHLKFKMESDMLFPLLNGSLWSLFHPVLDIWNFSNAANQILDLWNLSQDGLIRKEVAKVEDNDISPCQSVSNQKLSTPLSEPFLNLCKTCGKSLGHDLLHGSLIFGEVSLAESVEHVGNSINYLVGLSTFKIGSSTKANLFGDESRKGDGLGNDFPIPLQNR